MSKRNRHAPDFKAKVAMEALKGAIRQVTMTPPLRVNSSTWRADKRPAPMPGHIA